MGKRLFWVERRTFGKIMDDNQSDGGEYKHCRKHKVGSCISAIDYIVVRITANVSIDIFIRVIITRIIIEHLIEAFVERKNSTAEGSNRQPAPNTEFVFEG